MVSCCGVVVAGEMAMVLSEVVDVFFDGFLRLSHVV